MAGDNAAFLLQLTEITALRRELNALAERESRWNHALVGSASGVWDQRSNGELYYSQVWRDIRGLAPDDPIASTMEDWLELVHRKTGARRALHCTPECR